MNSNFKYDYSKYQPAISNNYWLIFEAGSSNNANTVPMAKYATTGKCFVTSIGQPEISTSAVTIPRGPYKLKVPGKPEYGEFSVSFYCDSKYEVMQQLFYWQARLYAAPKGINGKNQIYAEANVKRTDYFNKIIVYKVNNITGEPDTDTKSKHWVLHDAWPSSVSYGTLAYDSAEALKIEVTFLCQKIEYIVGNGDSSKSSNTQDNSNDYDDKMSLVTGGK